MFEFIIGVLTGIAAYLLGIIIYNNLFIARGNFTVTNHDDSGYIGIALVSKITNRTKKIVLCKKHESR